MKRSNLHCRGATSIALQPTIKNNKTRGIKQNYHEVEQFLWGETLLESSENS
jgi:hypothetical protein